MARQWRLYWNLKSIVGVGLIGLGLFVLCGNLADIAVRLSWIVGVSPAASQTFGGVIAVGLVASQVWRAYMFDRWELLLGVCGILISVWPLLLITAGAVLTRPASWTRPNDAQNKNTGIVDLTAARSTRQ